jgi:hypothetical protein
MTELKNFFGEKLCETTVPRNIRLAEAPSHGKAALVYDPRSKGAESYIKLAKEIIERQPPAVIPQPAENLTTLAGSGEASGADLRPHRLLHRRGHKSTEERGGEIPAEMDKSRNIDDDQYVRSMDIDVQAKECGGPSAWKGTQASG